MIKHFTATIFVIYKSKIALHWHNKVEEWLPAGGHIDKNETPVEAGLREVKEEMGIEVEILTKSRYSFDHLTNIPVPEAILIESVFDKKIGNHEHIDFIYFAIPTSGKTSLSDDWIWVTTQELLSEKKLINKNGLLKSPPDDVIKLGVDAIKIVNNSN
ncbi:MAG: NUDIX domain-containing protein [Dehalococcoidales bacterium]|jgi:8-oxo-dGTP pyrophosphatase MutT (NUDIX family)|nr:NUDIX domain-containing protein [Dehalococcoidales bacterium]